jgi:hypothetical protein
MRAAAVMIDRPMYAPVLTVRETVATRLAGIFETADHLSPLLIVCGQRGRGALPSTLLGSMSHTLVSDTRRQMLIAPDTRWQTQRVDV